MVVGEIKTCLAVVALLTCGSRSMRAREAVSVRGGRAAVLRGSAPHERTRRIFSGPYLTRRGEASCERGGRAALLCE